MTDTIAIATNNSITANPSNPNNTRGLINLDWNTLQSICEYLPNRDCWNLAATCKTLHQFVHNGLHIKSLTLNNNNRTIFMHTLKRHAKWLNHLSISLRGRSTYTTLIRKIMFILNTNQTRLISISLNVPSTTELSLFNNIEHIKFIEFHDPSMGYPTNNQLNTLLNRMTSVISLTFHGVFIDLRNLPNGKIKSLIIHSYCPVGIHHFFTNNKQCSTLHSTEVFEKLTIQEIPNVLKNLRTLRIQINSENQISRTEAAGKLDLEILEILCFTLHILEEAFNKLTESKIKKNSFDIHARQCVFKIVSRTQKTTRGAFKSQNSKIRTIQFSGGPRKNMDRLLKQLKEIT